MAVNDITSGYNRNLGSSLARTRQRPRPAVAPGQKLDLLRVARLDHGAIAPRKPAPYAYALAGKRPQIEPCFGESGDILPLNADGEIAAPIFVKLR